MELLRASLDGAGGGQPCALVWLGDSNLGRRWQLSSLGMGASVTVLVAF
jgi:hypothetical protein